jgi:signal transduction histidine kinase
MNTLADEAYNDMAATAAENGVVLKVSLDEEMSDSMFDATKLHDGVLNILGNAVDATRDQTDASVEIATQFDREKGRISIAMRDNGPGIPETIRKKIFEPFFSTKGSKGTGLGLAVTQKVVREHGGDLLLETEEGVGTCFTIWVPHIEPQDDEDA